MVTSRGRRVQGSASADRGGGQLAGIQIDEIRDVVVRQEIPQDALMRLSGALVIITREVKEVARCGRTGRRRIQLERLNALRTKLFSSEDMVREPMKIDQLRSELGLMARRNEVSVMKRSTQKRDKAGAEAANSGTVTKESVSRSRRSRAPVAATAAHPNVRSA
jgi:hypothetical protein